MKNTQTKTAQLATKGERTLERIIQVTTEIIQSDGIANSSQEAVAKAAGISQSTLRHHFPTKDQLISAAFARVFATFRQDAEAMLLEPCNDPLARIEQMANSHISHIMEAREAYTFEGFAYFSRIPEERPIRDAWYAWLIGHYAALIQQVSPEWEQKTCNERAFMILHTCLGTWITLNQTGPCIPDLSRGQLKALLLTQIRQFVQTPN
jgi:AcrR family transcriptional regulator